MTNDPAAMAAITAAARAWWKKHMPASDFVTAVRKGNGRVDVYWRDMDESGRYTLPEDFQERGDHLLKDQSHG